MKNYPIMNFPMKIRTLCLIALTTLLGVTATYAQEPVPVLDREALNIYSQADLVIRYHKMNTDETREALRLVSRLYGRKLYVESKGGPTRPVDNLFELNDMIVIYDTAKEVEKIVAALDEVDAVLADSEAKKHEEQRRLEEQQLEKQNEQNRSKGHGIISRTYTPRFVSAIWLGNALTPLAREFQVHEKDGSWHMTNNLRASDSPAVLLIRDTEANVKMIMDRILEIDRPVPQVMLSAYLLSPSGFYENGDKTGVPEALAKNLAVLTPYEEFDRLSLSSIRTNIGSREETILRLNYPAGEYGLALSGMTYDPKTRSLSVGSARLRKNRENGFDVALHTTFAAIEGEYAVIGISEEDGAPMLLAITFQSIAPPKVN